MNKIYIGILFFGGLIIGGTFLIISIVEGFDPSNAVAGSVVLATTKYMLGDIR